MSSRRADGRSRRLIVLGSTGSIGVNTLAVADHLRRSGAADIEVCGLAAGSSVERLIEQARRFDVRHVAIADETQTARLREALPRAAVFAGPDSAEKLVTEVEATDVAAAMVGSAGLPATIAAIRAGCRISLANKETLVAAGALVAPLVREHGAQLLPVDSEHSAIFQCLHSGSGNRESGSGSRNTPAAAQPPTPDSRFARLSNVEAPDPETRSVKRIVLTASGGPFRTWDRRRIADATPEEALKHPTWNMGPKITIDSASMMNKALEVIEAHWLFGLPADRIEVIVHPESVVHSFVEFADHSVLAQLGSPDMRVPIQYALTHPDRPGGCGEPMDLTALSRLNFEPPDPDRFPSLRMAYEVIEAMDGGGGTAGAVFNAANEAAVAAFLERRIRFGRIFELVADTLTAVPPQPIDDLGSVLEADRRARACVDEQVAVTQA